MVETMAEFPHEDDSSNLAFPYQVMTGAAGIYAGTYGQHLETPECFLFMAYLTCLGSVLSNMVTLESEIAPQPRLFTLLLGESADERKSTVLNKTTALFKDFLKDFHVCMGIGSAEGMQGLLDESKNKGLLLCFDEFKSFVSKCKIESSVLLPCVNTLFESNTYETHTKKHDIVLENAYLNILAASTVQTYEHTWDTSFTDIGFNNRLFIVPATANRKFSLPQKIGAEDKTYVETSLLNVIRHANEHRELKINKEARELYHKWYMSLERSIHAKRLDTYATRLMVLLAINNLKSEIDAKTVEQATALCDWQLEVRKLHDPIDADNTTAKMEEKIRRQLRKGPMTDRMLKSRTNCHRVGIWFYETAQKNLQRAGEIKWMKKEKQWALI